MISRPVVVATAGHMLTAVACRSSMVAFAPSSAAATVNFSHDVVLEKSSDRLQDAFSMRPQHHH